METALYAEEHGFISLKPQGDTFMAPTLPQ